MDDPRELRGRAEHYRRTAVLVTDAQLSQALLDLAEKYERLAASIIAEERPDRSGK